MKKVINMFRKFSMGDIVGYNELPNWKKDLFDATYKKHLFSIPIEKRAIYAEYQINKIVGEGVIVKVYFNNGDCYFYLPENKWMKVPLNEYETTRGKILK